VPKTILQIQDLTRDYHQGDHVVHALAGVNVEIEAGEFTAIVGPSGSGKTTMLNLIGALDAPSNGSIRLEDQELTELNHEAKSDLRRDRIGFIFQSFNLIPVLSAVENAAFVLMLQGQDPRTRTARATEVLAQVGLAGLEDRRPNQLSGGQQQRVAVARAIATRPTIVLADEPTANLDSETKADLISLMRGLNEEHGVTFLFSTHDAAIVEAARRVIRLKDGKIVEDLRK
jgi:putative ABC transport system ATP-binding protein